MKTEVRQEVPRAVRRRLAPYIVLLACCLLVAVTAVWGNVLDHAGNGIALHAAPLFAASSNHFGPVVLVPVAIAVLVVWRGPGAAKTLEWRRLCAVVFAITVSWGIALALTDVAVPDGLTRGVGSPVDLLAQVRRIAAPGPFLDTFTERIDHYVVHVRSHPPGLVLALWWMRRAGLGGASPLAAMSIAAGGATVIAAPVALRDVAGEAAARRAAPFLALSPAVIWTVVSADAIYAAFGAIGVAALIVASSRTGPRSDAIAALGGLALGAGLFMSYGLVALWLVPVAVCASRRRWRPVVIGCAATVAVGLAFAAFGFSWIDGAWAARKEYAQSIAALRPYGYFVFANLAAFAVVLGPAPLAGLGELRDRRWLLVGSALVAVLIADVSGLSKGEVERIWLPFWPWIAIAASALVTRVRWWLAAQAVLAIAIQTFLGTPW